MKVLVFLYVCAWPMVAMGQSCPAGRGASGSFAAQVADSGRLYHGALRPDGRELWYFKKVGNDPRAEDYRLFRSAKTGAGWRTGVQVTIGADASDLYPAFTPDGKRLVFASYRRAPGDTLAHPSASLWVVELKGQEFGEPVSIGALARPGYYFSQLGVRGDGALQFRVTSPDWSSTESMLSAAAGNSWVAAVPDTLVNRWTKWRDETLLVWGGELSPDGQAVVLEVADRDSTTRRPRQTDLWVSVQRNGRWLEPRRLGPSVNDPAVTDNFAFFSPNGCTLIWTRDFSRFEAAEWSAVLAEVQALQDGPDP